MVWLEENVESPSPEIKPLLKCRNGKKEREDPTTVGAVSFLPRRLNTFEEYQVLFPIPQDQIRINPATTQNPGY